MRLRRRLAQLEHRLVATGPVGVDAFVAATRPLRDWLRERGWTAQEALDHGDTGPAGDAALLQQFAAAERHLAVWRRERFGDTRCRLGCRRRWS